MCDLPGAQENASIVSDGEGGVVIVWADKRSTTGYDIYAQRLDADGNSLWTPGGVPVCTFNYDQYFPVITATDGGYIIAWQDVRSVYGNSAVYAQKLSTDGTPKWTVDGIPVSDYTNSTDQFGASVTSDGAGGAYVAWRDARNDMLFGKTDIYLQRLDSNGMRLWTDMLLSTTGVEDRDVSVMQDGEGGVILVWQDGRGGASTGSDIYAQRVAPEGQLLWGMNGLGVCTAPDIQRFPRMTTDGSGGAIISWDDRRSGTAYGIYAQRISSAGTPLWASNGVEVCALPNSNQVVPTISQDGLGGAFIAWTDSREGSQSRYFDIYAQRVTSDGTLAWDANGVTVCNAPGWQGRIRSAAGDNGEVFFAWLDNRRDETNTTYDYDIYVQSFDLSGNPQWSPNGVIACTANGKQELHQIVSVNGKAVLVWQDNRVDQSKDVYAQKIGLPSSSITPVATISDGKNMDNGIWISVEGKVVTAVFGDSFYIQETDRSSGIRVYAPNASLGEAVTVQGRLDILNGERVILDATILSSTPSLVPKPVLMPNRFIGGADFNDLTPGITDSAGLNNIGLLIGTWGTVTQIGEGYLYIDDGCGLKDGTFTGTVENIGVRVICDPTGYATGDFLTVTGISSCFETGNGPGRRILTRGSDDVRLSQ